MNVKCFKSFEVPETGKAAHAAKRGRLWKNNNEGKRCEKKLIITLTELSTSGAENLSMSAAYLCEFMNRRLVSAFRCMASARMRIIAHL